MGRQRAFPRTHMVYPTCNQLAQTHEGMGARRGRKGVVWGGWGVRPVGKEVLSSPQLEARIGGDQPRDRGQVVH